MSSYPPVRGGAGGQSFTLGPEQNIFSGADRAAAEAARDAYAGANPAWLAIYDDPVNQGFLNIRLDYAEAGDPVADALAVHVACKDRRRALRRNGGRKGGSAIEC